LHHKLTLLLRFHVAFDDEWMLILIKLMFNNTRSRHFKLPSSLLIDPALTHFIEHHHSVWKPMPWRSHISLKLY
jgi:hypothetical protein